MLPDAPDETDDLDTILDAHDDTKDRSSGGRGTVRRDARGRIIKGSRAVPNTGRPVEVSYKARRAFARARGFTVLSEVAAGQRDASPTQIKALEILLDRGWGKAVDVATHVHLLASTAPDAHLDALNASVLTELARQLIARPALPAPLPTLDDMYAEVVEAELVEAANTPPSTPPSAASGTTTGTIEGGVSSQVPDTASTSTDCTPGSESVGAPNPAES